MYQMKMLSQLGTNEPVTDQLLELLEWLFATKNFSKTAKPDIPIKQCSKLSECRVGYKSRKRVNLKINLLILLVE